VRWQRIVDPAFEMDLPQDDEARERFAAHPWLQPWAVSPDLELRMATSCVAVTTDDGVVLVDPFCTFGDTADFDRRMRLLADAGIAATDVTTVVLSHVDGVGFLFDHHGAPAFTNARCLVPGDDLTGIGTGDYPELEPLLRFAEPHDGSGEVAPGVQLVELAGHQPGHAGIALGDPWEVLAAGHLLIHPSQVLALDDAGLDEDVATAAATRRAMLGRAADEGFAILGPLWPSPGAAHVVRAHDGFELVPVDG
jgi:glyoxylase-like metal-dependent hydrolase (beta-lactamase superfamily II)